MNISDEQDPMTEDALNDFALQVAAITTGALIHVGAHQYVAHMFDRARKDELSEKFYKAFMDQLSAALTPTSDGIKQIGVLSTYMSNLSVQLEGRVSEILAQQVGDKNTVVDLDSLCTTRDIFYRAAKHLHSAIDKVAKGIVESYRISQERKCMAHQLQKEISEHLTPPEETTGDKQNLH